uniref:CCHC-type domain-containing protein n=1 Tax=Ananas comosus var. bracteatus TaxID=296719 RepID=A0A6V7PSG5_ANACO|nr:unnamed protein product [Ananas comosus var. bracteatus]
MGRGAEGVAGFSNCYNPPRASYKEVLMGRAPAHSSKLNTQHLTTHSPPRRSPWGHPIRRSGRRCFRCLASDHSVAVCRGPLRCYRCRKTGHRAFCCREKPGSDVGSMNRAAIYRGRPPVPRVYVPYTEEYLRRVELRRNAILADAIQPANLGPDPIPIIKSALASRFRGYTEDFAGRKLFQSWCTWKDGKERPQAEGGATRTTRNGEDDVEERAANRNRERQDDDRVDGHADVDMEDAPGELVDAEPNPPTHREARGAAASRVIAADALLSPAVSERAAAGRHRTSGRRSEGNRGEGFGEGYAGPNPPTPKEARGTSGFQRLAESRNPARRVRQD